MSTTETPRHEDVRRYVAARSHRGAHERKKKAAGDNGISPRRERGWGIPHESKGGPQHTYGVYLETAQDPYRLLACNLATVKQLTLRSLSNRAILERIHELRALDALQEGKDNSNGARQMSWLDRADDTERDATHDLELTALYRECEARGIPESAFFGGLS